MAKGPNKMVNSKLQMLIDCLDAPGNGMPLEIAAVYSSNFIKCCR